MLSSGVMQLEKNKFIMVLRAREKDTENLCLVEVHCLSMTADACFLRGEPSHQLDHDQPGVVMNNLVDIAC